MSGKPQIVLINPGLEYASNRGLSYTPTGLAILASVLQNQGFEIAWLDLQLVEPQELAPFVRSYLRDYRPIMVGIGGTSNTRFESFAIAKAAKAEHPEALVVFGGSHATFTDVDTLEHIPEMDCVVRGEGEETLGELAERVAGGGRDFTDINGITWRSSGDIVANPGRERIKDLSRLPWPDYDLIQGHHYISPMQISEEPGLSTIYSRGCPYGCVFCSSTAMWGSSYTFRESTDVVDEIVMLKERYGIEGIKFFDSILSLNRKHLVELCQELIDRKVGLRWECDVRADTVDPDLLDIMKDAGCQMISVGLESADDNVRHCIGKKLKVNQVVQAAEWARARGIFVKAFLMIGNPGETLASAHKTVDFIESHVGIINRMPLGPAKIYPGTMLEKLALANGCLPKGWSWSEYYKVEAHAKIWGELYTPIFTQPGFGYEEINKAMYHYFEVHHRHFPDLPQALPNLSPASLLRRLGRTHSAGEVFSLFGKGVNALQQKLRRSL